MSVVDIAMATFNGDKYLNEQIESIISQSFKEWRLFIRDDGSNDNTVDIIRHFVRKDSRIHLIEDNLGNLRVSRNFEQALSYCNAPYTMFADQDDIWFEKKIDISLAFIKSKEKEDNPILVFSNSTLVNETLSKEFGNNYNFKVKPNIKSFLFCNAGYQGSAIIINKYLRDKLNPFFPNSPVHDYHISITGLLLGQVYHLDTPLMYYRRHEKATTNNNINLRERIIWLLKNKSVLYNEKMLDYLKTFVKYHEKIISDKELVSDYFKILDKNTSVFIKINLILKNQFVLRGSMGYLIFKILYLK